MARGTFSTSNTLMSATSQGAPFTDYPFTVSLWFNATSTTGYHVLFSCTDGDVATGRNILGIKDGEILHYASNTEFVHTGLSVSTSTWYHLVWHCASSTSRKATLNTTTDEITTTRTFNTSANRWSVGIVADSTPSSPASAYVTHVGAWNVAFSDAEAQAMYTHRLSPLCVRPKDLVLYAPLNDGDGHPREWVGGRDLVEAGTVGTFADPPRTHRQRRYFFPVVPVSGGVTLAADPGAFAISGTAVTTDTKSPMAPGTFSVTGTAITTDATCPVGAGSFAVGGTAITTDTQSPMTAGGFLVTGTSITAGLVCPVAPGAVSVAGSAITTDTTCPVASGAFVITGTDATLIPPGTTLAAESGSFAVTGTAATTSLTAPVGAGSFAVAGTSVTTDTTCPTTSGTFAVTGTAATTTTICPVLSGSFVVSGTDATLIPPSGSTMSADPGTFAVTGTAATFATTMPAASAAFVLTGQALDFHRICPVAIGAFSIAGTGATLIPPVTVLGNHLPVSVAEIKRHLGVSGHAHDVDMELMITAGARYLTRETGRALTLTEYSFAMSGFPDRISIPYAPLKSVVSVMYYDPSGADTEYTGYQLTLDDEIGASIRPAPGGTWPAVQAGRTDAVRVTYQAGYSSPDEIPGEAVQFIKLWCKNQHDNPGGEPITGNRDGLRLLSRSLCAGNYLGI